MVSNRVHTVDLRKPVPTLQLGSLGIGDNEGTVVKINVLDSGSPAGIDGTGVTAYFMRSDGTTVVQNGSIDGNVVNVSIPEAALAVPGRVQMAVRGAVGGVKLTIVFAEYNAKATQNGTIVDPGHVVPSIDDLLAQISRMEQATSAATSAAQAANAAAEGVDAKVDSKVATAVTPINDTVSELAATTTQLKGDIAEIREELAVGGLSDEAADMLCGILRAALYTSDQSENITVLRDLLTIRPTPSGSIEITWEDTEAIISGLAGTNVTFTGTTATIGA